MLFRKSLHIAALLLLLAAPLQVDAYTVKLITSVAQLSSNGKTTTANQGLDKLLDGNTGTYWNSSGAGVDAAGDHYLQVCFNDDNIPADEDIWLDLYHVSINNNVCPVVFRVEGSNAPDDDGWTFLCNLNVLWRDSKRVFAGPIHIPAGGYRYMRFTCLRNTATKYDSGTQNHYFLLAEFQINRYSTLPADSTDTADWTDPYHLRTASTNKYADYTFEHSLSFLRKVQDAHYNWNVAAGYLWDAEGNFLREAEDGAVLRNNGIELPEYKYWTHADDHRIADGIRQPTHVVEHTLYAVPGDVILLYPFYAYGKYRTNYMIDYSRWYDYATDSASPYIDCLYRSSEVQHTPAGMFDSYVFTANGSDKGSVATFLCPPQDTMPDEVNIAVDFSLSSATANNVIYSGEKILREPLIAARHIFTVKNGAAFAEELSATKEANEAYVAKHRHRVSARAGVAFQQRLDYIVPYNNTVNRGYSNLYYKTPEGLYFRMNSAVIEAYDVNGTLQNGMFSFSSGISGVGDGSPFNNFDAGRSFYRFLYANASKAVAGRYTVKIYGCDEHGNTLTTADGRAKLQIAEYEVTFLPAAEASLVKESVLATEAYRTHRPEYLDVNVGNPQIQIDYDGYRAVEGITVKNGNTTVPLYTYTPNGSAWANGIYPRNFRWPLPWDQSTYFFAYANAADKYDYNVYSLANHSSRVRYKAAANQRTADDNFGVSSGLFDRRFYDTEGREAGYFFYVNAAADPGTMAIMNIPDLCSSSRLYVSAWMAEFSTDSEVANAVFNFTAHFKPDSKIREVLGDEVVIHTFSTGYVTARVKSEWHHVYYTFSPNFKSLGITNDDIDYYTLDMESNCQNSSGADFAIDDIRVYVAKPRVYAEQQSPLCDATERGTTVQVEIPFDVLLASTGGKEVTTAAAAVVNRVFYTVLDKAVYDATYGGGTGDYVEAFNTSVVRYQYMPDDANVEQAYGWFDFSSHYASNGAMCQTKDDEKMIVFTTQPTDDDLRVGKEYYIVLYMPPEGTESLEEKDFPYLFDLNDMCVKMCEIRVKGSSVVKIDGVPVESPDNIWTCADQMPVVQLDLYGKPEDGSALQLIKENAFYDWYVGTNEEFDADSRGDLSLNAALANYRIEYPQGAGWDSATTAVYTEAMRDYIGERVAAGKLVLYQDAYVIHTTAADKDKDVYVTAIPIDIYTGNYTVCSSNIEIKWHVAGSSPTMAQGFREIPYPDDIAELGVRVGIAQIRQASTLKSATATAFLTLPIRLVAPANATVTDFESDPADPYLYLIGTDDPEYEGLRDPYGGDGLIEVGLVQKITAHVGSEDNRMDVSFFNDFKFKEGYYYQLKFRFSEASAAAGDTETSGDAGDEATVQLCDGEHSFVLKVVPEYQAWSGSTDDGDGAATPNLNWNNDANWARVASTDLYRTRRATDNTLTDGTNANPRAGFAPLHFTKVIIPAGASYPHLYEIPAKTISTYNGDGTAARSFPWSDPAATGVVLPDGVGAPTAGIQYDMCAYAGASHVYCRPWFANNCTQIDFRPAAEIDGQHWLAYDKAWVEMEVTPGRWYTLAAPLQSTYAGDMYLPTATARQETELFTDIKFDTKLHNRFAPAVYQRGWDKAVARVYELGKSSPADVAISATWSHVYNDVAEPYRAGLGYSIKVDSDADAVLFRLPKADASYYYYTEDGATRGHSTRVSRDSTARLTWFPADGDFTLPAASSAGVSRYYLVGNPFMAHLDMRQFLAKNAALLAPKYWVLSADCQRAAVMSPNGTMTATDDGFEPYVAPTQGFFVELADGVSPTADLSLTFHADMAVTRPGDAPLRAPTRAATGEADAPLRITATSADAAASMAAVRLSPIATADYDEAEDVALLYDSHLRGGPIVYTMAGHRAAVVNQTPDATWIPLGLLAPDSASVTLRFDGVAAQPDLALYDSLTDVFTPLYDGMTYAVVGSTHGRLFLTTAAPSALACRIGICLAEAELTVTAPAGEMLTVAVHDLVGRTVATATGVATVKLALPSGIYMVTAATAATSIRRKIIVR